MSDPMFGTVDGQGDRRTVRFSRYLPVPPDEVWDAITSVDRLREWLADSTVDLRVGGRLEFRFEPDDLDQTCTGRILACRRPALLEYEWHWPGEDQSVVRFDLSEDGDGTLLLLTHRLLPLDSTAGYGAGWHAYLDILASLFGAPRPQWLSRFQDVKPAYEKAAATT
jgi:uncharacterized protein YndB with AHSA1/START domain